MTLNIVNVPYMQNYPQLRATELSEAKKAIGHGRCPWDVHFSAIQGQAGSSKPVDTEYLDMTA
jgi:hypothetical protein